MLTLMPEVGPDFLELLAGPIDVVWVRVGAPPLGMTFDLCHAPPVQSVNEVQVEWRAQFT